MYIYTEIPCNACVELKKKIKYLYVEYYNRGYLHPEISIYTYICTHTYIDKWIYILGSPLVHTIKKKRYEDKRLLRMETPQNKCKNKMRKHNYSEVIKKDEANKITQT